MTTRRVPDGWRCTCGHVLDRPKPHEERPAWLRHATARVSARMHVGNRPLIGVAVYQALTENA